METATVNKSFNSTVILIDSITMPIDSIVFNLVYNPVALEFQSAISGDCQITGEKISDSVEQITLIKCNSLAPGALCMATFLPLTNSADTTYTQINIDGVTIYPLNHVNATGCTLPLMVLPACGLQGILYTDSISSLSQNYPNPFAGTTQIHVTLGKGDIAGAVLNVYNMLGERVANLTNQLSANGDITFAAGELSAGVYYYVLQTSGGRWAREMFVVK